MWSHPRIITEGKTYLAFVGTYHELGKDRFQPVTLQVIAAVTNVQKRSAAALEVSAPLRTWLRNQVFQVTAGCRL